MVSAEHESNPLAETLGVGACSHAIGAAILAMAGLRLGGAAVTPPSTKGGETAVAVQEPGALASWVGGRAAANVGGLCGRVAAAIRRHASRLIAMPT